MTDWNLSCEPFPGNGDEAAAAVDRNFDSMLLVSWEQFSPWEGDTTLLWTPERSSKPDADLKLRCLSRCVAGSIIWQFNITVTHGITLESDWLLNAETDAAGIETMTYLGLCFSGKALKVSAESFTDDPCYLPKREAVVQAARALLAAVTRLLILADMIDVMCLLQHVSSVSRQRDSSLRCCFHY